MTETKRIFLTLFLGTIVLTTIVMADNIPSPPPLADQPPELQHYLRSVYENFHRLPVITTNPDGSRRGKKGDMVLLQTGGNSYLEINSDSGTTWLGIVLTNTP